MDNQRVVKNLGYLYRIIEAGERGYIVAASNVSNRALKILFQMFSQQRRNFKEEIGAEIERLGGHVHGNRVLDFLGIVHRGRIDIFAALTIGAENIEKTILKEVMIGERVALAAYENILKKDLPYDSRALVTRQFAEIRRVVDQVRLLRGRNGKRMVVRLYDTNADAEKVSQSLKDAAIPEDEIQQENMNSEDLNLDQGRGTTILETIISGGVGGVIWGTVAGILATIGIYQMASFSLDNVTLTPLPVLAAMSALGLIAGGAFIGSMIGLFIGWGIASEDRYATDYRLKNGHILVRAKVDESVASRAWDIMNQVAMESRQLQANARPV
jgi:uncharacterized protein (TIGR02284 family)